MPTSRSVTRATSAAGPAGASPHMAALAARYLVGATGSAASRPNPDRDPSHHTYGTILQRTSRRYAP